MSYNTINKYKSTKQRIDTELNDLLKNNAIKTGMSIPRISNELANYLKSNGWEITAPTMKLNNPHASRRFDINNYRKRRR